MVHPERDRQVVDSVVGALSDRSKRVRWRAGEKLVPWAAEVNAAAVEEALAKETNTKVRTTLEWLLQQVKEQQSQK